MPSARAIAAAALAVARSAVCRPRSAYVAHDLPDTYVDMKGAIKLKCNCGHMANRRLLHRAIARLPWNRRPREMPLESAEEAWEHKRAIEHEGEGESCTQLQELVVHQLEMGSDNSVGGNHVAPRQGRRVEERSKLWWQIGRVGDEPSRRIEPLGRVDLPYPSLTHTMALARLVAVLESEMHGKRRYAQRAILPLYEEDMSGGKEVAREQPELQLAIVSID
eukprot:scaffold275130_cov36-Tisochrysis_lutea.AAC.2